MMYFDYIRERVANVGFIQEECGFVVYTINAQEGSIFVRELYVAPRFRKTKVGTGLMKKVEEIAKKDNINVMVANIDLLAKNYKDSLRAALAYGFEISGTNHNMVYLFKALEV